MEPDMTMAPERRARRRLQVKEHGVVLTRVRPGYRAHLVDVSASGALIETSYRLLPGTSVELHLETGAAHTNIRGRVLRSAVVRVRPSSVCYRGAIAFDRDLPWYAADSAHAADHHEMRTTHPQWVAAAPEVI
jgi:PilZ domain-containing protein